MATQNDRGEEGRNAEQRSASPATATSGAAGKAGGSSGQRSERGSVSTQTSGQKGGQTADSTTRASSGTTTSDSGRSIQRTDEGRSQSRSTKRGMMRSGSQGMMGRGMPFSPWELVRRMSDELGQLVTSMEPMRPGAARRSESLAPTLSSQGATLADLADESAIAWVPQIEVQQRPNELVVRADLPGVAPDLVEVSVDDGLLTISGERQQEEREERDGFIRTERVYGAFSRTIPLPDGADEDHVTAAFRDGVLEIIVPVTASERGRRVPVDREQGGSSGR